MISCVRKSHLCSTSLISSALSHTGSSPARASARAAARRASARRPAPESRCRTSLRAGSDAMPTRPSPLCAASQRSETLRIVADPFTRPLHRTPRSDAPVYRSASECAVNNEVLAIILGGGQGSRLFPLTQQRSKPAVPIGGQVPADRHPDQQLPARRHPAHLRPDAVQLGVAQPAHRPDLPDGSVQPRLRRDPRRRADARQPELVPGHGRRGAAGGAPLRRATTPTTT